MSLGNENDRYSVFAPSSLGEFLVGIRQRGWEGAVKVSLQLDESETLEYVQMPEGEWQLFGGASSSRQKRFSNLDELEAYVKELKPQAATMMTRNPMVYMSGKKSGQWSIRLIEVAEISRLIGEDTFAAFQKCFVGADRLKTLSHFHALSLKQDAEDSPSSRRNFNVVLVLLHEIACASGRVCGTSRAILGGDFKNDPWRGLWI